MKNLYTTVLIALMAGPLAAALPAMAQTAPTATQAAMETAVTPSADMVDGEVRKISKDTGKLTIKHGEIKNLDMPPMTMVFTAQDPAMLDTVAVGDKIRFKVVDQSGKMVVTDLQPVK